MDIHQTYVRFLRSALIEGLEENPIVLLHGARQTGKTTLARNVGDALGYAYVTFDEPILLAGARRDPAAFVASLPERVILDEVQHVPEIFPLLKQRVDINPRPGQFILTGSANIFFLPALADSLAGRMEILRLSPLTQGEIINNRSDFLSQAFRGEFTITMTEEGPTDPPQLAQRITGGGYPIPLRRKEGRRREVWYRDYIESILQKDVRDLGNIRSLDALPRLLKLVASQTATLENIASLAAPFQLTHPTIATYTTYLEHLFLLDRLPPWHTNRGNRLVKKSKVHIADTGLGCGLLGIDSDGLLADQQMRGRMTETFVYQELRRQAAWADWGYGFYHLRTKEGKEVDIVIERSDGRLVGIEVKSSASVNRSDLQGLLHLKELAGKKFAGGIVLYMGGSTVSFGDQLFAMPIDRLWRE